MPRQISHNFARPGVLSNTRTRVLHQLSTYAFFSNVLRAMLPHRSAQSARERDTHPSEPMKAARAGQVIADRYKLEEPLGRGAMGSIWRAEHLRLKSRVALKFLDPVIADDPEMFSRFLREAQSAAAVR